MNISKQVVRVLEDTDMGIHTYEDNSIELETWTKGGVNMIIRLKDILDDVSLLKGIEKYKESFDIDEEIELYRQDESYKSNFTIKESLKDFESYLGFIDSLIFLLSEPHKYLIPVTYQSWGTVEVEAKDRDELFRKLNDRDFVDKMALPIESDYVDDSYAIDFEGIDILD